MASVRRMTGGPLGGAVAQRLRGEQPGMLRAVGAATVAGTATAVVVYRVLRSTGEEGDD